MKVKYIYSACIEIDCDGFKILTDPWFTDGAYDGSWYLFPKVNPFDHISKPDLIYVSHIHPDHYDSTFLKKLEKKYGDIPIIIPDLNPNYLLFKGRSEGHNLTPTRFFKNDKVEIYVEENNTGSLSDIDSALIVKDLATQKVLLNLNDCIYNQTHVDTLKNIINSLGGDIDFLALGYTGAGPYPQTYFDLENQKNVLIDEAEKKKISFYERYKQYSQTFNAKYNLPFAGEYLLGGKLHKLNEFRGVADAIEIKDFDDKAVILSNGGEIDLVTGKILNERENPFSEDEINNRISSIKDKKFNYEEEINLPFEKINFMRLISQAAFKAKNKSELDGQYHFIFNLVDETNNTRTKIVLGTEDCKLKQIGDENVDYPKYSEIIIDYRYFYGLLTTIYHWNNAEVGSHYFTRRIPNRFDEKVQNYLNFFTVA